MLEAALHFANEVVDHERLEEVVGRAGAECIDGRFDGRMRGDHDDRRFGTRRREAAHELRAGDAGHDHVAQDHVGCFRGRGAQSFIAARRRVARVAFVTEQRRDVLAKHVFVVDEENASAHGASLWTSRPCREGRDGMAAALESSGGMAAALQAGSTMVNWAPRPGSLSTSIVPPFACTRLRQMERPRPVPLFFVVKNGSKRRARTFGSMPGPLSRTAMRTWPLSLHVRVVIEPPPGIASTALKSRFNTTWSSSSRMPCTGGSACRSSRMSTRAALRSNRTSEIASRTTASASTSPRLSNRLRARCETPRTMRP